MLDDAVQDAGLEGVQVNQKTGILSKIQKAGTKYIVQPVENSGVINWLVRDPSGNLEASTSIGVSSNSLNTIQSIVGQQINQAIPDSSQKILEAAGGNIAQAAIDTALSSGSTLVEARASAGILNETTPISNAGAPLNEKTENEFAVKIESVVDPGEIVAFKVTPTIDESRSAVYDSIQPVHHPGSIQVYKTTTTRNLNINGRFIARTSAEAHANLTMLNYLRAWVMPYYGQGTLDNTETSSRLGAPPPLLKLFAYGDRNLNGIPVVLTNYSWTYVDDVTYIPDLDGNPVPTIMDISLTFMEGYSPSEFSQFSLLDYKQGNLGPAFNASKRDKQ